MSGPEKQDKRKFPRANFPCKVIICLPREHACVTHTENIGCGGIRILIDEHIPLSSVVGLELFLEPQVPIRCKGKVIWVIPSRNPLTTDTLLYDTGLEFRDISESDTEKISGIVRKVLQESYD